MNKYKNYIKTLLVTVAGTAIVALPIVNNNIKLSIAENKIKGLNQEIAQINQETSKIEKKIAQIEKEKAVIQKRVEEKIKVEKEKQQTFEVVEDKDVLTYNKESNSPKKHINAVRKNFIENSIIPLKCVEISVENKGFKAIYENINGVRFEYKTNKNISEIGEFGFYTEDEKGNRKFTFISERSGDVPDMTLCKCIKHYINGSSQKYESSKEVLSEKYKKSSQQNKAKKLTI